MEGKNPPSSGGTHLTDCRAILTKRNVYTTFFIAIFRVVFVLLVVYVGYETVYDTVDVCEESKTKAEISIVCVPRIHSRLIAAFMLYVYWWTV